MLSLIKFIKSIYYSNPETDANVAKMAKGLIPIGFFGSILFLVNFISRLSSSAGSIIAKGENGIFITILFFIGVCIWQYVDVKKLMNGKGSRGQNFLLKIVLALSLLSGIYVFFMNLFALLAPDSIQDWALAHAPTMIYNPKDASIATIIFNPILNASVIIGGLFIGLSYLFFFSKFVTGLALTIAIHNFSNGLGFDLSALWDLLYDQAIPDTLGTIMTLGGFIFSVFIGQRPQFGS